VTNAATESTTNRRGTRGRRTARPRLTIASSHVAALLALIAHVAVGAHAVSHSSQALPNAISQHCAVCAIGGHAAGIPAAVIAGCQYAAVWVEEPAGRTIAPLPEVVNTTPARGPPLSASAAIG